MDHLSAEDLKKKVDAAKKVVEIGGKYRHYKGEEYVVVDIVLHSETLEELVLYRPLYETGVEFWARPLELFVSEVDVEGKMVKRFQIIL